MARIVVSTLGFAVLHSLLASHAAKRCAARLLGERRRNAYYRTFFNTQAVVTSGALVLYIGKLPDRTLWKANPPTTAIFIGLRLLALWGMLLAIKQVGFTRIAGLKPLAAHLGGVPHVPAEPEAQGPALDAPIAGAFRFTRHPLNFLALPLIWLAPRISRNRFAFNCAATIYFVLGSIHEEVRLYRTWGAKYHTYQQTTRFLLGRKSGSHGYTDCHPRTRNDETNPGARYSPSRQFSVPTES